jgi:Na+/proline symporter
MIFGVYWKRANAIGALSGAVAGVISWILFKLFMPANYPHNLFGFFISCIVLVIVSLVTQKTRSNL